jgi:hypothetical protein
MLKVDFVSGMMERRSAGLDSIIHAWSITMEGHLQGGRDDWPRLNTEMDARKMLKSGGTQW